MDNARYRPMNTGRVAKVGRHPARGLKLASLYRRAVSIWRRSGSLAYIAWSSFTRRIACIWMLPSTCFFVSGNVTTLTRSVRQRIAYPYEYGTFRDSSPPSIVWGARRSSRGGSWGRRGQRARRRELKNRR